MARQAICKTGCFGLRFFQMAVQTPTHVHLHDWSGNCHLANVTMTCFAIETCTQMRLMAKVDKIGLWVHADPRNRLLSLPIARQFLYLWAIGGDDGVTAHAFFHRGYPGYV